MATAPTHVEVELQEEDLHQDLVSILQSMEAIRQEELAGRKITSKKKDEYLHLTYRLGSVLEGLADKRIVQKMQVVVEAINKSPALRSYDFMQDEFWQATNPEFSRSLDQILITLQGDEFTSLQDKQHIVNALKYLGSASEEFDERMKIIDTINPFNTNNTVDNRATFRKALRQAGITNGERKGGLVIKINSSRRLEEVVAAAGKLGYASIQVLAKGEEMDQIKQKYPFAYLIEGDISKQVQLITESQEQMEGKKTFNWWKKQVLHYIFGNAGRGTQEELSNRLGKDKFDPEYATVTSTIFNGAASLIHLVGYCGVGAIIDANTSLHVPGTSYWYVSLIGFANEGMRLVYGLNMYQKGGWGSLLGTALFSPLSAYFLITGKKKSTSLMEIPLAKPQNYLSNIGAPNYHPQLEELAQKEISAEVEQNLSWRPDNHHQQGELYTQALFSETNEFEINLQRKTGIQTYYRVLETGPYKKVQALICKPGERNVLTYITSGDKATDFETISTILANDQTPEQQVEAISQHVKAEYIHLSKFKDGKKVAEPIGYN